MTTAVQEALSRTLAGRYEVLRELGRGGMSAVYLARDTRHRRDVAVKVLLPELAASVGADRFHREIEVVAGLQHPHILPLFDSGDGDGLLYFVMPFVEGGSLRDRLQEGPELRLDEATRVLRQLADALDHAHGRGVIHRDLKPENVLLTGGQALLADFGIARADGRGASGEGLTGIGISLGTPAYMSPEQAVGDGSVDRRSDIYSLGCIAYELLTGSTPFQGATTIDLIRQHIMAPVPRLEGTRDPAAGAAGEAIRTALAKEPRERFATAGEFAGAIENAIAGVRAPSPVDVRLRDVERRRAAGERVLVLDFSNITGASDADWLSTGIVETVNADLGKIAGITVVGQDPASRRRIDTTRSGASFDAASAGELARELGARWVVWGAFQKVGSRVRITPHFLDVESGTAVGGEKLDGVIDDIFAMQDRIVTSLAQALRIQLTSGEVEQIARPETSRIDAYESYARGYRAYLQFGKESVRAAAEHFRAAIAIDPDYALAHAGLGIIHGPMYIAAGRREVLDEGARLLEKAISLDPTIGEAHAWLAYMQFRQGRFDDFEATARHGLELNPRSELIWYMLSAGRLAKGVSGDDVRAIGRAVPPLLRCLTINPDSAAPQMLLGSVYMLRGQYSHAVAPVERGIAFEAGGPGLTFFGASAQRAVLHMCAGENAEAASHLETAIARYTGADHVYAETMAAYAHFIRGCLREREDRPGDALRDFQRASEIADRHDHRINIGAHWVKGRLGAARVLHRLRRADEAGAALAEAVKVFESRSRFIWTWFIGGTDAEVLYELASTFAALGRHEEALRSLSRAADVGWGDIGWMRFDPAFAGIRDTVDVQRLCGYAAARITLSPPVGEGGVD
jgi:eukaryotic-like serine/threonine-protein kinase